LVELQRHPKTNNQPSRTDYRWRDRWETWEKASRSKEQFLNGSITENDVIMLAKSYGQWSIWFTVFKGIDSVRARLISDFPGTCASCFDAKNHYEPIERNPSNNEDPI
jgi:hypothetical protein